MGFQITGSFTVSHLQRVRSFTSVSSGSTLWTHSKGLVAGAKPRQLKAPPMACLSSPRKKTIISAKPPKISPLQTAQPVPLLESTPRHLFVHDNFLEPEFADNLRGVFDSRFETPRSNDVERFVWDYWHVPDQYSLMRTPAEPFFGEEDYKRLCDALTDFGQRYLGCNSITQPWLSYYVDGCEQRMHSDSWHGPFAYVLSLTRWDQRKFTGGETFILNLETLDYWRRFDPKKGLEESTMTTKVEPLFNRLTVFDPRLPHGVRTVHGSRDPREARLVIHGWFTDLGTPFYTGTLSEDQATVALNEVLDPLYAELGENCPRAMGVVNVRMHIRGSDGKVTAMESVADTLVPDPDGLADTTPSEARAAILEVMHRHLSTVRFPAVVDKKGKKKKAGADAPSGGGSAEDALQGPGDSCLTIPFVFE